MSNVTALLSVGIDTQQAKEDLKALKAQVEGVVHTVGLDFDQKSFKDTVQKFFNNKAVRVRIEPGASSAYHKHVTELTENAVINGVKNGFKAALLGDDLKSSVKLALDSEFGVNRRLNVNTTALYDDVHDTVAAALRGHVLRVSLSIDDSELQKVRSVVVQAQPGAAAGRGLDAAALSALVGTIQKSMDPVISSLDQTVEALKALKGVAKTAKVAEPGSREPRKTKAQDQALGTAGPGLGEEQDDLKVRRSQSFRLSDGSKLSVNVPATDADVFNALKQTERDKGYLEEASFQKFLKKNPNGFSESGSADAIFDGLAKIEQEKKKAEEDRLFAQREASIRAQVEKQKEGDTSKFLKAAAKQKDDPVEVNLRAEAEERAYLRELEAKRKQVFAATRKALGQFYERAKIDAELQGQTADQAKGTAARELSDRFGEESARGFLGVRSYLLDDPFKLKLQQAADKASESKAAQEAKRKLSSDAKDSAFQGADKLTELSKLRFQVSQAQQAASLLAKGNAVSVVEGKTSREAVRSVPDLPRLVSEFEKLRGSVGAARKEMGAFYEAVRNKAVLEGASPAQARVSAAQALAQRNGETAAREFLGSKQFLLDSSFKTKLEESVASATAKALARKKADQAEKEVAFLRPGLPGQSGELERISRQLRQAEKASGLVSQGVDKDDVIARTSQSAYEAIPRIQQMREEIARLKQGLKDPEVGRAFDNFLRYARVARPDLNADGQKIVAAAATEDQFGRDRAAAGLGNRASLLDLRGSEDNFARATSDRTTSIKAFSEAVKESHSAVRGFAGSLGQMWLTWGSTAPLLAGAAVGTAVATIIGEGAKLEYQLKFVQLLTEGAAISMQDFYNSASQGIAGPVQAAEGLRALAQNGLDAQQALRALPDVLRLATAGEMDFRDAALGATGVMEAFNLGVGDLGRVADVFSKAAANSNTDVAGMVEAMKQASIVSDQYNVTLEETAASLEVLAKRNIVGSAAGTAFRNMLVELVSPSDKAKKAMEQVGLEVFDSFGQIKKFPQLMEELNEKTRGLDEASKTKFFQEIFNERSVKAASALVTNFEDLVSRTKDLENNAAGFTKKITDGLTETALVKFQKLSSEFRFSGAEVFAEDAASFKNMLDELRDAVSSEGFKSGLAAIAEGVAQVGRFLLEYGPTIAQATLWFYGFKAALGVAASGVAAFSLATAAMAGSAGGFLGLFLRLNPLLLSTTALLGGVLAAFLALRKPTDDLKEAADAYANSLERVSENSVKEMSSLQERGAVLEAQIRYMDEGRSAVEARTLAEQEFGKAVAQTNRNLAAQALSLTKSQIAKLEEEQSSLPKQPIKSTLTLKALLAATGNPDRQTQIARDLAELRTRMQAQEKALGLARLVPEQTDALNKQAQDVQDKESRVKLRDDILKLSQENARNNASGKFKVVLPTPRQEDLSNLTAEGLKQYLEKLKTETNASLNKFSPATVDREADKLKREQERRQRELEKRDESALNIFVGDQRREEQKISTRQAQESRITAEQLGSSEYLKALAAEIQFRKTNNELVEYEEAALAALEVKRKSLLNLSETGQQRLESEIREKRDRIALLRSEGQVEAEIARIKDQRRSREEADSVRSATNQGIGRVDEQIRKIKESYSQDVVDPIEFARQKASGEASSFFSSAILKEEEKLNRVLADQANLERALLEEQDKGLNTSPEIVDNLTSLIGKNRSYSETLRFLIDQIKRVQEEEAKRAGVAAADGQAYSQTYQGGAEKFFKDMREGAENDAQAIYNVMKKTTDGLSKMTSDFATTGKANFKDFASGVLSEILRIVTSRALTQLLDNLGKVAQGGGGGGGGFLQSLFSSVAGAFAGSFGSAASASGASFKTDFNSFSVPTTLARNGAVMTPEGPLPLSSYRNGGIARSPQVAVFGEGRTAEAYVPLPDGRSIPVTMTAQGSTASSGPSVIINNYSGAAVQQKESVDSRGRRRIEVTIGEAAASEIRRPGSAANKAVSQSFNVRPTLVGR